MPSGGLRLSAAFLACALLGGLSPSLAAIVTSWVTGRRGAVRELLRRLLLWRQTPATYVFAVCAVPISTLASTIIALGLFGNLVFPDPGLLAMAAIWPLAAAIGEELGWRGMLLPTLETRFGLLNAALLTGLVWGLWHLPADYIALKGYGDLFVLAFLINGPVVLTAHSIIMAWLWRKTRGSLLIAVLYHWSVTASAIAAPTAGGEGWAGLLNSAIGAALVWALALIVWNTHPTKVDHKVAPWRPS
jgi:hypothetical protein